MAYKVFFCRKNRENASVSIFGNAFVGTFFYALIAPLTEPNCVPTVVRTSDFRPVHKQYPH